MPFTSKYPALGATKLIRIPETLENHVLHITEEAERLCVTHDLSYVLHILDKVMEGLEQVP